MRLFALLQFPLYPGSSSAPCVRRLHVQRSECERQCHEEESGCFGRRSNARGATAA